jgi:hypothetical protein
MALCRASALCRLDRRTRTLRTEPLRLLTGLSLSDPRPLCRSEDREQSLIGPR